MNRLPLNPLQNRRDEHGIHLRDGAVLAAKVFKRCAKMVEFLVVEDQKPVMEHTDGFDGQLRILEILCRHLDADVEQKRMLRQTGRA